MPQDEREALHETRSGIPVEPLYSPRTTPLERVLMTHMGCVVFEKITGELVEPLVAARFYPGVTVISLTFGGLLGGAIVTETVFTLDGMGYFFITKLGQLDLYAVMGYLLVTSVIIIGCNLFADVLYGYLDPRIRLD